MIATRLSSRDVPRSPGLMDVLAALQQRGLVVRLPAGDSATWAASATGAAALRAPADPLDALIAEIARGPAAAVPAVQRLAAAGTPLEETGAAVFDRADPRAPDAGFVLAFVLGLLDPPARAERVRALVAADEHVRLAALLAGWALLRIPARGALTPYLPEPAWTEALAAALDGPYPAAREIAALLALATDRLEALRDRLDPAAPLHRAPATPTPPASSPSASSPSAPAPAASPLDRL